MAVRLTDADIGRLLAERKSLPRGFKRAMNLRQKKGHREGELIVKGVDGSEFILTLRQANLDPLAFSVILSYRLPGTNQIFRLRRYNGKNHEHTNKIESNKFREFHVHKATERYQESGFREDGFAEPTDDFCDYAGAIERMMEQCAFEFPDDSDMPLPAAGTE